MRGTRVPAIVPSDFRPGTEVVGRLGRSCARTSTLTRNCESAPARTELGGRPGSLRMPTAAAARYRRSFARASPPAAHYGSPSRHLGASCDACARRSPRVRASRSSEATGAPRQAGASGHEKLPSTYPGCALTNCSNVRRSARTIKRQLTPESTRERIKQKRAKRAILGSLVGFNDRYTARAAMPSPSRFIG